MKKERMNVYLEPELKARIYAAAKKLGMQPGVFASLAIRAGLDAVSMATDPQWMKLFERMAKENGDLETDGNESPKQGDEA